MLLILSDCMLPFCLLITNNNFKSPNLNSKQLCCHLYILSFNYQLAQQPAPTSTKYGPQNSLITARSCLDVFHWIKTISQSVTQSVLLTTSRQVYLMFSCCTSFKIHARFTVFQFYHLLLTLALFSHFTLHNAFITSLFNIATAIQFVRMQFIIYFNPSWVFNTNLSSYSVE